MAKMGRPKSDAPRKRTVGIRLTDEEYDELLRYATDHDLTLTEAMLRGLRLLIKEPAT